MATVHIREFLRKFAIPLVLLAAVVSVVTQEPHTRVVPSGHEKQFSPAESLRGGWGLSPDEGLTYRTYTAKAFKGEYTAADIESLRSVWRRYSQRTGRPLPANFTQVFLSDMRLAYEYNRELENCLLLSLVYKTPLITPELQSLRESMEERRSAPKERLDSDFRWIHSVAYQTPWVTQSGDTLPPLDRKGIRWAMRAVEMLGRNVAFAESVLTRDPLGAGQDPLGIR